MLKKFVLMIALAVINSVCYATMFFPLPFDKQVEEATSGVEVRLASSRVFKNSVGAIMTEYSFDVLETYNFLDSDLENEKLKLTMPGGTFEGITSMIDGAPKFTADEKSFLLLKKIDSKIYLSNFTLGKFRIQESEGKIYYVSEVFPHDANIGRIEKDRMIELMKTKWKTTSADDNDKIMKPTEQNSRPKVISALFKSTYKREPSQESEINRGVPLFFWSSVGILGFFFVFIFFKLNKSGFQNKKN
ncbi:MAG: hypothetical protein WC635_08515 [Bacteriovorax sp.]|jgi:hypothetical protein